MTADSGLSKPEWQAGLRKPVQEDDDADSRLSKPEWHTGVRKPVHKGDSNRPRTKQAGVVCRIKQAGIRG